MSNLFHCRFVSTGCTERNAMSKRELDQHYEAQCQVHLALTSDRLDRQTKDNKQLLRALSSAQARCRQKDQEKKEAVAIYQGQLDAFTQSMESLKASVSTVLLELGKRDKEIKELRAIAFPREKKQEQPGEIVSQSSDEERIASDRRREERRAQRQASRARRQQRGFRPCGPEQPAWYQFMLASWGGVLNPRKSAAVSKMAIPAHVQDQPWLVSPALQIAAWTMMQRQRSAMEHFREMKLAANATPSFYQRLQHVPMTWQMFFSPHRNVCNAHTFLGHVDADGVKQTFGTVSKEVIAVLALDRPDEVVASMSMRVLEEDAFFRRILIEGSKSMKDEMPWRISLLRTLAQSYRELAKRDRIYEANSRLINYDLQALSD